MGIEISMSGSGSIGEIQPGWSVLEYATPVTIGEYAGGTGQVSLSAKAQDDSLLITNNTITTTHSDDAGSLGHISGIVRTVSEQGIAATISHSTPLERFDGQKLIPSMGAGSLWTALDLATQLTGAVRLNVEALNGGA